MATLIVFVRFFRTVWSGLKEPEFRAIFLTVIGLLTVGTLFYSRMEGWGMLDALYFTVITLTTVGYGDLSPTLPITKIFTIVYIFLGLGVFSAFVLLLAERVSTQPLLPGFKRRGDDEEQQP
jgi:hypothetical protein